MTFRKILDYCQNKEGSYVDFPFGDDTLVVKICGHYFALLFNLKGKDCLSVKCEPESGLYWRQKYPDSIKRGWHCPPVQQPYNNTIALDGAVTDAEIFAMIDSSYEYAVKKLTKKERASIKSL